MEKLKAHLFICTHNPPNAEPGSKCGQKDSDSLRTRIKKRCGKEAWGNDVRINSSGCLGQCENGIAAVLYPQNQWFLNLLESEKEDEEKIFQAVRAAVEKYK